MSTGRWFNAAAVEWAMYEAPPDIPPGAAWTLAVVASFTGADGRSAYPSTEVIAELTRRSKRQVQRDLDELAKRGLLMPGDRRAVARLRADRRPDVWDLPREAREHIDRQRKRGDTVSSRAGRRGDKIAGTGRQKSIARGDTMSPEEFMKNSGKGAPPARDAGARDGTPENPPAAGAADRPHLFDPDGDGSDSCLHCGTHRSNQRHLPPLRVVS